MKKKIAVLVPCYDEAITIKKVIEDFREQLPEAEIYVYDNNSKDDTYKISKQAGAIVRSEFRQGKGHVVRSMFEQIDADVYIMVDGDDTYPAKEVNKLLKPVLDNDADIVIGDRLSNGSYFSENKRQFHDFGNVLVRNMINTIFRVQLKDIMSGYRVFNKSFVKTIPVSSAGFQVETEMTIFALDKSFRIKEIAIDFIERPEGSFSKLNTFSDGFKVIFEILNMFRHYKPFTFFTIISSILLIIGFLVGLPPILEFIKDQYVYKVPSAILAGFIVMLSVISFSTGLILDTISKNERKQWMYIKKSECKRV